MPYTQNGLAQGARVGTRRRSTLTRLAALLTLTLAFCGLASAHADPAAPLSPTLISCSRTRAGQLLVPIRLTGAKGEKVEASFILDTGVNVCSITDTMATRLGLKSEAAVGDDGRPQVLNGTAAKLAQVPLLQLGRFPCGPVPCIIVGAKDLSGAAGQEIDGILGNNLLVALPALINLQEREVTFIAPGPVTADTLRSVGMADATAIPLDDPDKNDSYVCKVRIESGGRSLQKDLGLDIGDATTMINGSDARALGLSAQGAPTSEATTFAGPLKLYEGNITAITLEGATAVSGQAQAGNVVVQNVRADYPKDNLPDFLPPHLGQDVLARYLLLIDYAEKKMYLKPNMPQIKIRIGAP